MIQADAYCKYGPYAGKRPNQIAADVAVCVHIHIDWLSSVQHGRRHQQRHRDDGSKRMHHTFHRLPMDTYHISGNEKAEHRQGDMNE